MSRVAIETRREVELLVDDFYGRIRRDELLGPIFEQVIEDRWPAHLAKMYRFWASVLLAEQSYVGNPFAAHLELSLGKPHFDRWLQIFHDTVEQNFIGAKADEARWRAERMALMFLSKLTDSQRHRGRVIM